MTRTSLWLTGTLSLLFLAGCGSGPPTNVDPSPTQIDSDPDGDGVGAGDNCPAVANAGQDDRDGNGIGDDCDALATRLRGDRPINIELIPGMPIRPAGLLAVANGSDRPLHWEARLEPVLDGVRIAPRGTVDPKDVATLSLEIDEAALDPGQSVQTRVAVRVGTAPVEHFHVTIRKRNALASGECVYTLTLNSITVTAAQGPLFDGVTLEPVVDINAGPLGRYTSPPPPANHVIRAGRSVRPNVRIGKGSDLKGNRVSFQVIVDADEIDQPPFNPHDTRAQGQSGNVNVQFTCSGIGSRVFIVPVPIRGNRPGEANGAIEVELEVNWDP